VARAALASLALLLAACGSKEAPPPAAARTRPVVFVSNYPLRYFTDRIAGDRAEIRFPVPAGEDPAFWTPGDDAILAMLAADLILLNGATYEKWRMQVSLPESRCVDTADAFRDRFLVVPGGVTHSHGPSGPHSHAGTAFTTWLDLAQAGEQARAVKDALAALLPDATAELEARHAALARDLAELDEKMKAAAPKQPVFASHPVYQYWARRYGVDLRAVLWEPDEVPDEPAWASLAALVKERPAAWMIWEGPPAAESVARLKAMGITSVVFAPCANTPDSGDFLTAMRGAVERFQAAFSH